MNEREKQKRLVLAIALVILLAVLVALCVGIGCAMKRCGGTAGSGLDTQKNSKVIVTEVLADNKQTVPDPLGTFSDYVELYNRSDETVSLNGYGLADDEKSLWRFPAEVSIEPHGYLVVWCMKEDPTEGTGILTLTQDDGSKRDVVIANFGLSKDKKEVLRFVDPMGQVIVAIDLSGNYSGTKGDANSYGNNEDTVGETVTVDVITSSGTAVSRDDAGEWKSMSPSPGYPNTEEGVAAYQKTVEDKREREIIVVETCPVIVTEFMAWNANAFQAPDGSYCDWIELYNTSYESFDLSGYHLSDDMDRPDKFTFPQGSVIGGHEYLLLYQAADEIPGEYCFDFGLSSQKKETVYFTSANKLMVEEIDRITFEKQQKNCSYARVYENGAYTKEFKVDAKPTPGFVNSETGRAQYEEKYRRDTEQEVVNDIIVNEVLVDGYYITYEYSKTTNSDRPYDADLGSWIELYNKSDAAVDLTGYSISDNETKPRKWVFPEGTSIAGKGYLVLQLEGSLPREGQSDADVTEEQKRFELNFDLKATGETVFLYNSEGSLIDHVTVPRSKACVSYGRDATGEWKLLDTPSEGAQNALNGRDLYCEQATADTPSGIYKGVQTVNFTVPEGCYATYTLSCGTENDPVKSTAPTETSDRVSGPIAVKSNTVLRIRTFSNDGRSYPSEIKSYTYVIVGDEETVEAHNTNLPVVFLVTDPENLWDKQYGIMIKGNDYKGTGEADEMMIGKKETMGKYANFNIRGRSWEKPATFTYMDAGGKNVLYEEDLCIRIFGAFSRKLAQKGIALIARKGVGDSRLRYQFFANRPADWEYKSLVLRASGQDAALSRIRDVMVQGLLDDAKVNIANQAYVQCIVYINGQYWGVYNLREKVSKFYIAQHYGIEDVDTLDILKWNGNNEQCVVAGQKNERGKYQGLEDYMALIAFCENRNCDLSNQADYDYVCSQVDADQFAMYCAFEIIIGNTDTGNIKWWRSTEKDNKWRWIQYDYCWAMNGDNPDQDASTSTGYRRDYFWKYFDPAGHGAGKGFSTVLGRSMMSNNEFVKLFLKWCAYFYNEVFTPEKILAKVDELQENIRKEMETYDLVRWRPYHDLSTKGWNSHCDKIRNYAKNYQDWYLYYCQHYINEHTNYRLTDDEMIRLFGKVGKIS